MRTPGRSEPHCGCPFESACMEGTFYGENPLDARIMKRVEIARVWLNSRKHRLRSSPPHRNATYQLLRARNRNAIILTTTALCEKLDVLVALPLHVCRPTGHSGQPKRIIRSGWRAVAPSLARASPSARRGRGLTSCAFALHGRVRAARRACSADLPCRVS